MYLVHSSQTKIRLSIVSWIQLGKHTIPSLAEIKLWIIQKVSCNCPSGKYSLIFLFKKRRKKKKKKKKKEIQIVKNVIDFLLRSLNTDLFL